MCNSCDDKGELFVTTPPYLDAEEIANATGKWYRPLELSWWDCEEECAEQEPIANLPSLSQVEKMHAKFTKAWKSSIEYQKLRFFFNEVLLKLDTVQITSCLCLCLGSVTEPAGCPCCNWPLSELVAFESWIELLRTKFTISHVYFQDPKFNTTDTEFLLKRGFEILHTPESDKYITTETFLFAPFGNPRPIVSSIHAAHPSLLITTDLSGHRWFHVLDEDTEIPREAPLQRQALLAFLNKRVTKQLPKSKDVDWLRAHYIYYKPSSENKLVPVKFDIAEEDLFPIVEDEARILWERKKSEGGDLSGNIRDPDVQGARDAAFASHEKGDEWPVPWHMLWKEKFKTMMKAFVRIGR